MAQQSMPENAPGSQVFPQFARLHDMVASEVEDLTEAHLDWSSDRWEWSKWSIRFQVSHIASFFYGWLLERWGQELFPQGFDELGLMANYVKSPGGWWMDEARYPDLPSLLKKVKDGVELAQHILAGETLGSMRIKEVPRPKGPTLWRQLEKAHPTGTRWTEPDTIHLTLEATFRHLYYEAITHLYNIQRLKRAQGLTAKVEVPFEGYWALPDWDRSEA